MKKAYNFFFVFIFLLFCMVAMVATKQVSKKNQEMIIGFTGDVMLGRLVNEKIKATDYTYPWGNILQILRKNDLNIINLETAVTKHAIPVPKVFNFKTDPENVQTLLEAHINIVNLANNHVLDFGPIGLRETLQTLKKAGIDYVGAGNNAQEAQKALIITKNNITFGIIGFTDNEPGWLAKENKPGTNYIEVGDINTIKKQIEAVRPHVDILIATMHWGPNMRERPTMQFVNFAHQMIDFGIDIVHGTSAHLFQAIENYRGKVIMYDTGDFIDDYAVESSELRNDISFLFQVKVERKHIKEIKLIPITIENMQVSISKSDDYKWAIARMQKLSKEFNTEVSSKGLIKID